MNLIKMPNYYFPLIAGIVTQSLPMPSGLPKSGSTLEGLGLATIFIAIQLSDPVVVYFAGFLYPLFNSFLLYTISLPACTKNFIDTRDYETGRKQPWRLFPQ